MCYFFNLQHLGEKLGHEGRVIVLHPCISLPASNEFCPLVITFANILDPDQARQNVGPDINHVDPNCLSL